MTGIQICSTLLLIPFLLLLPGWVVLTGERRPHGSLLEPLLLSVAISGWAAQTLALVGLLTIPLILLAVAVPGLVLLLSRRGLPPRLKLKPPGWSGLAAGLGLLLIVGLLYCPPLARPLGPEPLPTIQGLGHHLARTGALPDPLPETGLDSSGNAMREIAGAGLFFPAWLALLGMAGGAEMMAFLPTFFTALTLAAIFTLGRRISGSGWFGAILLVALGLNYPQAWLARTAVPEAAGQLLLLATTLFYLRAGHSQRMIPAAAICLGSAVLTLPGLRLPVVLALLMLLALHGIATEERRRSAALSLMVVPFLAQSWLQSALLGQAPGFVPPIAECVPALALVVTALLYLRLPVTSGQSRFPVMIPWFIFTAVLVSAVALHWSWSASIPGGTSHWLTWYLTFPFAVLLCCGLLTAPVRPVQSLKLLSESGLLFPLALVSLPFLLHNPGAGALQPWAARPFIATLIPAALLAALLFFRGVFRWLPHPLMKTIWASSLFLLLGLNLANLMPLATGHPGSGGRQLVEETAAVLKTSGPRLTLVVESGAGALGLHTALEGGFGFRGFALGRRTEDRDRFTRLVRENASAGQSTALLISEGVFTPDPEQVALRPISSIHHSLRLLPPAVDHLPSSVVRREMRLQLFEAVPGNRENSTMGSTDRPDPAALNVRVSVYGEDWPYLEQGFLGITQVAGQSFRWTSGPALIRLPTWASGVTLEMGGFRPPGAPTARISVGFPGLEPHMRRELPRSGFISLFIPCPPSSTDHPAPRFLELHSSTFHPAPWLTGENENILGIQLTGLTFHRPGKPAVGH